MHARAPGPAPRVACQASGLSPAALPPRFSRRSVLAAMAGCAVPPEAAARTRLPSLSQDGKTFVFVEPMVQVPDVVLQRFDGKQVRLLSDQDRRPVLLNFWASWCPPCRLEIPFLQSLYDPQDLQQPRIVAVSVDRGGRKDVAPFLKALRITTLPIYLDPAGMVGRAPQEADRTYPLILRAMPLSYVLTGGGQVVGYIQGMIDWRTEPARAFFRAVSAL